MASYTHILEGFSLGFCHRNELRCVLDETAGDTNILTLDPDALISSGISVLAIDFDGVLAHHGAAIPLPEAADWLKQCESVLGGDRIFILSNKPTYERIQWFAENFPALRFISGVRKKPYPDGLIKVKELAEVTMSSILMIDDRLLTGCLAALTAGARVCYIRRPYISFSHRPFSEMFFMVLRTLERIFVHTITVRNR